MCDGGYLWMYLDFFRGFPIYFCLNGISFDPTGLISGHIYGSLGYIHMCIQEVANDHLPQMENYNIFKFLGCFEKKYQI